MATALHKRPWRGCCARPPSASSPTWRRGSPRTTTSALGPSPRRGGAGTATGRGCGPGSSTSRDARPRRAVTQLLEMVGRLNERRMARSDRSADFRTLARWFLECDSDGEAHRLWRTAFGLTPARHLTIDAETAEAWQQTPVPASTPWVQAPGMQVQARLRATGSYQKPGAPPKLRSRARERELLARQLAEEASAARAARRQLVERRAERLSELGELDDGAFRLLLNLLGDALAASAGDDITDRKST